MPQPAASSTLDKPSTVSSADAASSTAAADTAPSTTTADAPSSAATTGAPSSTAAAHSTSSTAAGDSSSTPAEDSGVTSKAPEKEQKEQREPEDPEKTKEQQEAGRRGTAVIMQDHGVSKEALKGPQDGSAGKTAAEFEKEGKHGAKTTKSNESSEFLSPVDQPGYMNGTNTGIEGESGKSDSSKGSDDKSSGNGKPGAMSKMKDGFKKVVHPHSSKQSN